MFLVAVIGATSCPAGRGPAGSRLPDRRGLGFLDRGGRPLPCRARPRRASAVVAPRWLLSIRRALRGGGSPGGVGRHPPFGFHGLTSFSVARSGHSAPGGRSVPVAVLGDRHSLRSPVGSAAPGRRRRHGPLRSPGLPRARRSLALAPSERIPGVRSSSLRAGSKSPPSGAYLLWRLRSTASGAPGGRAVGPLAVGSQSSASCDWMASRTSASVAPWAWSRSGMR